MFNGWKTAGSCRKRLQFQKTESKKRPGSCPSLGRDSCNGGSQHRGQVNACKISVKCDATHRSEKPDKYECNTSNVKQYRTRFFYSSSVKPKVIEAALARKNSSSMSFVRNIVKTSCCKLGSSPKTCQKQNNSEKNVFNVVKSSVQHNLSPPVVHPMASSSNGNSNIRDEQISGVEQTHVEALQTRVPDPGLNLKMAQAGHHNDHSGPGLSPSKQHTKRIVNQQIANELDLVDRVSANATCANEFQLTDQCIPIYDVNYAGVEEKFINSIMHFKQFGDQINIGDIQPQIFQNWREQSDFDFGFIPLGEQQMPNSFETTVIDTENLIEIHKIVKQTKKPNFMQARIPVTSQLNDEVWQDLLKDYWDQQLLQLLRFGFPLDFNRNRHLHCEGDNHSSATQYPKDVDAYIQEETSYGAILGPFKENPIQNSHTSPFMTRNMPNSDRRRVIIDLSWPLGASVNAGIDKDNYLGSPFALTFPTVDVITGELKRLGRGALLYKIDVSRAFCHVRIDPGDYDLLGLHWHDSYVDTCLPFGTRHGSQIFQHLSDAVHHVMCQRGFCIIDYIDDYVGVSIPDVASASFASLFSLMNELGLTISDSKLVPPSTQVVCLGVLIDTEKGTVSIPPDKLRQINDTVRQWIQKETCTKRQLQSILGLLLYVHKCVKPARAFLNRMLSLLRAGHASEKIHLTPDFRRGLRWFAKFLPLYNGVSLYDHRPIDHTLELDACLTGLGGRWCSFVYHLLIPLGFMNWSIVKLEMVNILVAVRLFQQYWAGRKVLIKCDIEAVVSVLKSGKTKDPYLGACARNIWYVCALADIDVQYTHIRGLDNRVADLLSRWTGSGKDSLELKVYIPDPVWIPVDVNLLEIDPEL